MNARCDDGANRLVRPRRSDEVAARRHRELVSDLACAERDASRDRNKDDERQEALRKHIFACAIPGKVDFDILCDRVLANMPEPSMPKVRPHKRCAACIRSPRAPGSKKAPAEASPCG